MKLTDCVNVFHGCAEVDLPTPTGLVKNWAPIKGLAGNTTPAATLPFGKYSVCAYSGGYPTGYGVNRGNYGGTVPKLFADGAMRVKGFSHFHNSGVGAITVYYNYAVVTPFYGEPAADYGVADETARPGYYAVTLSETAVRCEMTATERVAYHRYTFARSDGGVSVDFLNNGLYDDERFRGRVENPQVAAESPNRLTAAVTLEGVRLYFAVSFEGPGALDAQNRFRLSEPGTVVVRVSVSAVSAAQALEDNRSAVWSFDEAVAAADRAWEQALSAIQIDCDDPTERELFYSYMYHTLVKPNDWQGGSFLWSQGAFVVDFSTMWDIYKTQLPLLFSLYPAVSAHIVETLQHMGESLGKFPNAFMLSDNFNIESAQARLLIVYTLYDAYVRGVEADWPALFETVKSCLQSPDFTEFQKSGRGQRHTHTLDLAGVCYAVCDMAAAFGDTDTAAALEPLKGAWKNAFDTQTGLLRTDSEYYEGTHRNYSFRLAPYAPARVALCGSTDRYVQLLDDFFGYNGVTEPGNFEGFNNETDMETPWAYHYAGRADRLCELLEAADRQVFRDRRGGAGPGAIPGNNDSGALSACYLWNCLGLFPVSGSREMLLGCPKFSKAVLTLAGGRQLTILKQGEGRHPMRAWLNGRPLPAMTLSVAEFMAGGELVFAEK